MALLSLQVVYNGMGNPLVSDHLNPEPAHLEVNCISPTFLSPMAVDEVSRLLGEAGANLKLFSDR